MPASARRGRVALAAAVLGVAVVGLVLGLSYYREVVAPSKEWVARIEGKTILTTGQLARAIVVRELASGSLSPESELGRAPFVLADERVELELMRTAAPGMALDSAAAVDAEVRERFQPRGLPGDTTPDDEIDRLFRESYLRFLTERGVSDDEYRASIEAGLLRERFVEAMGSIEALEEWLASQRAERSAEVRVGSSQYAWVLDEVRTSRPVTGLE